MACMWGIGVHEPSSNFHYTSSTTDTKPTRPSYIIQKSIMRIFCSSENEDRIEIEEAINRDPSEVRSLLIDALLACCRHEALPDTADTIYAEESFRLALAEFRADDESQVCQRKHMSNVILNGQSGARLRQQARRAELVDSSLKIGGPLALAATLYATHDIQRSLRSKKTFEALEGMTDKSREDLYQKCRTFPVHSSFKQWFKTVLYKRSLDAVGLASLLHYLGTTTVPLFIFSRIRMARGAWGENGEAQLYPPDLTLAIVDRQAFEAALQRLKNAGVVQATSDEIRIDRSLTTLLYNRDKILVWKTRAVQLLIHILPTHPVLEPQK